MKRKNNVFIRTNNKEMVWLAYKMLSTMTDDPLKAALVREYENELEVLFINGTGHMSGYTGFTPKRFIGYTELIADNVD